MALTHLYTSTVDGPVPVTIDLYEDPLDHEFWGHDLVLDAEGEPDELEITDTRYRHEDVATAYGSVIRATWAELTIIDPERELYDRVRGLLTGRELLVHVSWPPHTTESGKAVRGGTVYLWPALSEGVRTIAPLVYPLGAFRLRLWDRVGALADIPAPPAAFGGNATYGLQDWISRVGLAVSPHLPVIFAPDAWPVDAKEVLLTRFPGAVRMLDEPVESSGGFGTLKQQAEVILASQGLVLFQNTSAGRADPTGGDGPGLWIVHRRLIGAAIPYDVARYVTVDDEARSMNPVTVLADELVLEPEDFQANGEADEVEALRSIRMEGGGDIDLIRQPFPPDSKLAPAEAYEQFLGRFAPTPDVRAWFRVAWRITFAGSARLRLEGESQTYHLASDGSWSTSTETFGTNTVNVKADPFPVTGNLIVRIANEEATTQRLLAIGVSLIDGDDNFVTDWIVQMGNPTGRHGEQITMTRPPRFERLDDQDAWAEALVWETELYPDDEEDERGITLPAYMALDRLSQQAEPLSAPRVTIGALVPSGTRVTFPAASVGRDEAVECVVGGGMSLDLRRAATEAAYTELLVVDLPGAVEAGGSTDPHTPPGNEPPGPPLEPEPDPG